MVYREWFTQIQDRHCLLDNKAAHSKIQWVHAMYEFHRKPKLHVRLKPVLEIDFMERTITRSIRSLNGLL